MDPDPQHCWHYILIMMEFLFLQHYCVYCYCSYIVSTILYKYCTVLHCKRNLPVAFLLVSSAQLYTRVLHLPILLSLAMVHSDISVSFTFEDTISTTINLFSNQPRLICCNISAPGAEITELFSLVLSPQIFPFSPSRACRLFTLYSYTRRSCLLNWLVL